MPKVTKTGSPLYRQIYDDLLEMIIRKKYSEGDIMPPEKVLQAKYNVSRITIRRAMEMLQDNGYIEKKSGIGTVVISNKHALQLKKISSFRSDNLGRRTFSRLIDFKIIEAPAKVLMNLNLKKGSKVYVIERLRLIDNEKVGFHRAYIPKEQIELSSEQFSEPTVSLYELFEKNGLSLATADETIEAIIADEFIQKHLELKPNSPLLYIERALFDDSENAIEYVEIYYRADRYKYNVRLEKNKDTI